MHRDRWRHRSGREHGGAGREANFIFVLPPNVYVGPPVGGTFWFQIFIQAASPETWRKTIFGGEGGCWRGKWGGLFWATSLEKIFGGVIAIISFRPGDSLPCRGVLSFRSGAREASGSETPRVHNVARGRGGGVAARGARGSLSGCGASVYLTR
jgi:hypothetical protein